MISTGNDMNANDKVGDIVDKITNNDTNDEILNVGIPQSNSVVDSIITDEKLEWVVNICSSFISPEPDRIFPPMLQNSQHWQQWRERLE